MCVAVCRMIEGMTQLMFKGYEESRVALTALLFTMPCCILMGVEYAVFMGGDIKQVSYQWQTCSRLLGGQQSLVKPVNLQIGI
jgi:hypothetical protein